MSDHDHDHMTFTEFVDEHWVLFFFGLFFLMTLFLPTLFLSSSLVLWSIVIILGICMALLLYSVFLGKGHKKS